MRPSRHHLLLVPGGLAAGHAAEATCFGGASTLSAELARLLLCVGAPMAMLAVIASVKDGWSGRRQSVSAAAVIALHAAAFAAADFVEHAIGGVPLAELLARPGFWAGIALHGLVGLGAWLALRAANCVGRVLAATAGTMWRRPAPLPRPRPGDQAASLTIALSSLSRRGPPAGVSALISA